MRRSWSRNSPIFTSNNHLLEHIRRIYATMSKGEKRYLRNFLEAFHVKGENTALKLLEILDKGPLLKQSEISAQLYGDPKSKGFLMLKARFMERMMEVLALSINLENNPSIREDRAGYAAIEIQKQLVYTVVLRRRGLYDLSREILNKCIKQAEACGFPEYQLMGFIALRNLAVSSSVSDVQSYAIKIQDTLNSFTTDLLASEIFDTYQAHLQESGGNVEVAGRYLQEKESLLEEALNQHYSTRAHYYHLSLLVTQAQGDKDYFKARDLLQDLADLLETNKHIASKNRLGTTYLRLAAIELQTFQFENGYRSAKMAAATYPKEKTNFLIASTYLIFACLYRHQYSEAQRVLDSLSVLRSRKRGGTFLDLVLYLESCLAYLNGNFKLAYDLLGDVQRLFSDKSGWNINLRIFEIMLLIDRDLADLASPKIEALRKHISRYKPDSRLERMFRFLVLLDRQSFDFRQLSPEMEQILLHLREDSSWDAVTPEVIKFDVWISSHHFKKPFLQVFAQEVAKIEVKNNPAFAEGIRRD